MEFYKTWSEAEADGWVRIKRARNLAKRVNASAEMFVADNSGADSYGYSYCLRVGHGPNSYGDWTIWEDGLESTTIGLSEERNKIGRLGCYAEMFPADELQAAVDQYEQRFGH